jgi:hypothetical protein
MISIAGQLGKYELIAQTEEHVLHSRQMVVLYVSCGELQASLQGGGGFHRAVACMQGKRCWRGCL